MDFYNVSAKRYNELYGEEQLKKFEFINSITPIKGKVLDVGCGDCQLAARFDVDYFGVEPSKELVFESKFKNDFELEKIQLCAAEDMNFDEKFDLIISVTAAHHFEDAELVFKKCNKYLNKDGKLIVSLLSKSSKVNIIFEFLKKYFDLKKYDQGKDIVFVCELKDKV